MFYVCYLSTLTVADLWTNMKLWWNDELGRPKSTQCHSATFSTVKPTRNNLELNPSLRS